MEEIRRGKKKKFREKVYFNGREIKSPLFTKKTDAVNWKSNKIHERTNLSIYGSSFNPFKQKSFESYATAWLRRVKLKNSIKTYKAYESNIRVHLIPFLTKRNLLDIKLKDGERFIQYLIDKNHSPKGIKNIVLVLKGIMNDAEKDQEILTSPFRYLVPPKVPPKIPKYWPKQIINRFLLANKDDELYPLYITALNTGLRKGELAALMWHQIYFERNLIEVSHTRDVYGRRDSTKSGKTRFVPMNPVVRETMLDMFHSRSSEYVFVHEDGSPLKVHHLYRIFKKAQEKANLPEEMKITFHQIRDTFASQFMMNGGGIYDLQKLLGHHSTEITQIYAHLSPDHLAKTTEILDFGASIKRKNEPDRPYIGHKNRCSKKVSLVRSASN